MLARFGRVRMVEPRSRFEDDPACAAAADEIGQLLDARHALAPAADLRAQSARGDLVELDALEVDRLVLPLNAGSAAGQAAGAQRKPRAASSGPVACFHDRQRSRLVLRQLGQPRRGPDKTAEHPGMLALPRLPVLGERLCRRQAGRREHRGVIEEPRQEGMARIVGHEGRGYTGRGPGPVQWEPANRVRSGRKQR